MLKKRYTSWIGPPNNWHSSIVVPEHKLVFMYCQKAGSSSLKRLFLKDLKYVPGEKGMLPLKTTEWVVKNCKDWLKIGVVRNPYSRIVSCWYEKTQLKSFKDFRPLGIHHGISFRDFVSKVSEIPDEKIDRHLISQSAFMYYDGHLVPDYLFHLESLQKHWPLIQGIVKEGTQDGLEMPPLRHDNKHNGGKKYRSCFDTDIKEKHDKRYEEDIRNLGYEF